MLSRIFLRKPTVAQVRLRVQRDRETGIPNRYGALTRQPTREEVETWAILAGYDSVCYTTLWVYLDQNASLSSQKEETHTG